MLYKKRWSDGLNQDFDHLNDFEAKFYCFGGDGGGDSGGGGGGTATPSPKKTAAQQNASAAAQEPVRGGFRGEQSAAVEAAKSNLSSGNQSVADTVQDQVGQAVFDSGYYDKPTSQTAPGIADMFPNAVVPSATPISGPADPTKASLSVPSLSNLPSMVDMINMAPAVNAPVNVPTQPTQNINPLSFEIGPGTVSPTYDNTTKTYGVNFTMPFSTSSVSQQGIGSLNQQRVMDALTSGVNNPQTTTAPTTDVAFLDTMQNVFGTLSGPTTYKGNLAKKGNTYTSASSGGITSTRKQKNMFDQIAGTGKNLANQVGLGSLFD